MRVRSELPTLAYVYPPRSFATMSLVEAATGRCHLLWIIDSSDPDVASMARLLKRFGTCIDVAGLDLDGAVAAITPFQPDALLTLADDCLVFGAELADRLGLAFTTPDVGRRLTDKHAQRAALASAGLEVPRQWLISPSEPSIFEEILRDARFPAVLKPRRGEGSRDTMPISTFEELTSLWRSEGFADSDRDFVFEEYIPDSEEPLGGRDFAGYVSVESVVSHGVVSHLAINGRMPPAFPFRETGFFIPADLDEALSKRVLALAASAAHALGVIQGCLHTEIKLTPTGPVVIEVNGRIGGGVPEMLMAATGINLLAIAFDVALGVNVVLPFPTPERLAYLFYVQAPAQMSCILAVEGLAELREESGVEEIILNRGPGADVSWRHGNHGHVVSVLGTTANHDGLRRINTLISQLIRIEGS